MSVSEVRRAVLGMIGTNVYFLIHTETKACLIIDPADDARSIYDHCRSENLRIEGILLTHGHFDHIFAAEELSELSGAKIYAAAKEHEVLTDPYKNSSAMLSRPCTVLADTELTEGEEITLAGFRILVMETPGHTAGSICYYIPEEKVLFSGDTLFHTGYGRTDLPTGNSSEIVRSVRRLLKELPEDTKVYPGHMEPTDIGFEKKYNPIAESV